jgi:hypothetical protein
MSDGMVYTFVHPIGVSKLLRLFSHRVPDIVAVYRPVGLANSEVLVDQAWWC